MYRAGGDKLGARRHEGQGDGTSEGTAHDVNRRLAQVFDQSSDIGRVLAKTAGTDSVLATTVAASIPGDHLKPLGERADDTLPIPGVTPRAMHQHQLFALARGLIEQVDSVHSRPSSKYRPDAVVPRPRATPPRVL